MKKRKRKLDKIHKPAAEIAAEFDEAYYDITHSGRTGEVCVTSSTLAFSDRRFDWVVYGTLDGRPVQQHHIGNPDCVTAGNLAKSVELGEWQYEITPLFQRNQNLTSN